MVLAKTKISRIDGLAFYLAMVLRARAPSGSSVKRFTQIPLLSIDVEFECTNIPWEPKMLIGRLRHTSLDFGIRGFESKSEA